MLLYVTGEPQPGVPDPIAAGIAGCWAGSVMNSAVSADVACGLRQPWQERRIPDFAGLGQPV